MYSDLDVYKIAELDMPMTTGLETDVNGRVMSELSKWPGPLLSILIHDR